MQKTVARSDGTVGKRKLQPNGYKRRTARTAAERLQNRWQNHGRALQLQPNHCSRCADHTPNGAR